MDIKPLERRGVGGGSTYLPEAAVLATLFIDGIDGPAG